MREGPANGRYNTGMRMKGVKSTLYASWSNMKQRCSNPRHHKYSRYGGRGISVCHTWKDAEQFIAWALSNGWREGLQIDRVDNDGPYCPENCRWLTPTENARRKSTTKLSEMDAAAIRHFVAYGFNETLIADHFGVSPATIWFIKKGATHRLRCAA